MSANKSPALGCRLPPREALHHDADLLAAIVGAAGSLRFDSRPGSLQRQCTIGLFVAALSDRLALSFPRSASALSDIVFGPATVDRPVAPTEPSR
jgi:hypothetical protein